MRSVENKICLCCLTSLISTSGVVGRSGVMIVPSAGAAGGGGGDVAAGAAAPAALLALADLHLGLLEDFAADGGLEAFPLAQASNNWNGSDDFLAFDGAGVAIVNFAAVVAFK